MALLKVTTQVGGQDVVTVADYTPANEISLNNLTATSPINLDTDVFLVDGTRDITGTVTITESVNDTTLNFNQTGGTGNLWSLKNAATTGRLELNNESASTKPFKVYPSADTNLLRLGHSASNTVNVKGNIDITGVVIVASTQVHPDYVFEDDYELKTIEQYSELMWKNKHLPSMTSADEVSKNGYDVDSFNRGILEGLEYAHIYIDQLNKRMTELESHL